MQVSTLGRVVLGRFRLDKPIGQGASGEVFRATDMETGGAVAVKRMRPALRRLLQPKRRFARECEVVRRLDHPAIPRVIAHGDDEGLPVLVTELLTGGDLRSLVAQRGPLEPAVALPVAARVAEVLEVAHRAGVLHRDLKPANILCAGDALSPEAVRVLDFGAAFCADLPALTGSTERVGSPWYRAPEQDLRDPEQPVSAASDLCSLGWTLIHLLLGERAVEALRGGDVTPLAVLEEDLRIYVTRLTARSAFVRPSPARLVARTLVGLAAPAGRRLDPDSALLLPPGASAACLRKARRLAMSLRVAAVGAWALDDARDDSVSRERQDAAREARREALDGMSSELETLLASEGASP